MLHQTSDVWFCESEWISQFRAALGVSSLLRLVSDPQLWNESHVKHWIRWAVKEFSLVGVDVANFNLTGKQLCDLQHKVSRIHLPVVMFSSHGSAGDNLTELQRVVYVRETGFVHFQDFVRLIPNDKGDIFWTHLELLRKCKFVGKLLRCSTNDCFWGLRRC